MSIPAMAKETDGVIEAIDQEHAQIRLSDGEIYHLPSDFDYQAITKGMTVVVIYDADEERPVLQTI
nr:DUF1344 domain-containing protein [Jiella flava]